MLDCVTVLGLINIELALQQDRDISRRCLERLHIFDQKERLQHAGREGVTEIALRSQDDCWTLDFNAVRIPSNIPSKVARRPTGNGTNHLATS